MPTPKGSIPWNKGKGQGWTDKRGYRWRRVDRHGKFAQIREHRFIMEQHLGRILEPWETVHHKDGNQLNNSIENLELMDLGEHTIKHCQGSTRGRYTKETISMIKRLKGELEAARALNLEMYGALEKAQEFFITRMTQESCEKARIAVQEALKKARGES